MADKPETLDPADAPALVRMNREKAGVVIGLIEAEAPHTNVWVTDTY